MPSIARVGIVLATMFCVIVNTNNIWDRSLTKYIPMSYQKITNKKDTFYDERMPLYEAHRTEPRNRFMPKPPVWRTLQFKFAQSFVVKHSSKNEEQTK